VRKTRKTFDDYLDRARDAVRLAAGVGAGLTTALADVAFTPQICA
jgi:hypothetical protein